MRLVLVVCLAMPIATLLAQNPPSIQAGGSATINVNPDQAQLNVGVTTQASTAQAAAEQNASQTTAVIAALKALLGSGGSIQTVGYTVYPNYTTGNVITGYTVTNTLQATTGDLSLPGPLIDAANKAGATNVGSLAFGLKDSDPVRQQALTLAGKQALAHANAIAAGLGAKTGALLSAQEGAGVTPYSGVSAGATSTPILTGTVSVTATVTVAVQLVQ
ncbi:MAG: SIMPL domain-containing protein [Acidobacteriia bacterium]|nr:SIMPL domain-containing protein [Terriglobia bacterium]